jgi:hypothetical protein
MMTLHMNDEQFGTLKQVQSFNEGSEPLQFGGTSREEKYEWIAATLQRFKYFAVRKKDKSIIKTFLRRMSGFSDAQMTRLIEQKKSVGVIVVRRVKQLHRFARVYTKEDIALLMKTDEAHSRLSGPATKKIFQRMFTTFKDSAYERLARISVSHLYTLRGTKQYVSKLGASFTKTSSVASSIGERRKPDTQGKPGQLRVDTVHQGDQEKKKDVYHVNLVDEVTQWETILSVEAIADNFLLPLLVEAIEQFPFVITGFHSDNGSEFINRKVADMLNRLLIKQTKSRARRCNDNALIEGKNGSVIRKHMGRVHIPQRFAHAINNFYVHHFNPYLNFHRPSGFATTKTNANGKQKKVYDMYLTPYEKLISLDNPEQYLKAGLTLETLAVTANAKTDNQAAEDMREAKTSLFKTFREIPPHLGLIS